MTFGFYDLSASLFIQFGSAAGFTGYSDMSVLSIKVHVIH